MADSSSRRNRLAAETSPYLLQHADNPVDWYPWGREALSRALDERRPILLSIGYSACHWCHVMAHESFEDAATAETMNRLFVNIKVDREERPDLDRIYQTAHQLLARRPGGWPLTVFLSPEQVPFFSGTYFPREPRHGLPGFRDLLGQVAEAWRSQPEAINDQNEALRKALNEIASAPPGEEALDERPLAEARKVLGEAFDERFGGFGSAPKFPQPPVLNRLLRHYARGERQGHPDRQALHMASLTLRRMILGGIYDQLGGGFARYSVDDYWMIPHFEKMLYDNALLLGLATDVWRITGDALYARGARESAAWLMREMRHPEGGFYAALDADSEGAEGSFYLWTPDEIRDALPADQAQLVILRFGLDERPNFEGRWHLHVHMSFSELAKRLRCPREAVVNRWEQAQRRLLEIRDKRPRPHRDDKILTGWNALAARSLARAGHYLGEPDWVEASAQCLDFLHRHNRSEGRLRVSWKDGRASLPAYLDDYAFVLSALLEQLEARWEERWLDWACDIADVLLERFEDGEHGGFFFIADDHEPLIQRPRSFGDDALPAGNGVAALALARLGHLLGESRYIEASARALQAGAAAMHQLPHGHCSLLDALEEYLEPPETILIRPQPTAPPGAWRQAASGGYAPNRQVFVLRSDTGERRLGAITLSGHGAWLCRGSRCLPRIDSATALADRLASGDE